MGSERSARAASSVKVSWRCSASNAPSRASTRDVTVRPAAKVLPATPGFLPLSGSLASPHSEQLGSVRGVTSPNAEATTAETFDPAPPTDSDSAATSQSVITAEIQEIEARYRDSGAVELQPRLDYPPYRSTILRHPTKDLRHADPETIELWAPCFGHRDVHAIEADLTIQHGGEPIGERMVVTGRVLDGEGRPVRGQLVEIWQANAGGRYLHKRDQHPSPIDPNFTGVGRCLTGRRRVLPVHHDQAGAVPMEEPPQRLAPGAHPLLAVRH